MIGETDAALTYGGLVAIATVALVAVGIALRLAARSEALRERLKELEDRVQHHLENGARHAR